MPENNKPKLLLHICCAGCGAYISQLLSKKLEVALFYFNPNIFPKAEYEKRLTETKKVCGRFNLELLVGDYKYNDWLEAIKGREDALEKGERCLICYRWRLAETAKLAKAKKYGLFATTLTISPYKNALAISAIGNELADNLGINFFDQDFKKQDGFKKSILLSRELGLYRQNYCGCEYSIKQ